MKIKTFFYAFLILLFSCVGRDENHFPAFRTTPVKENSANSITIKQATKANTGSNNGNFSQYSIDEFLKKGSLVIVNFTLEKNEISYLLKAAKEAKNIKFYASKLDKSEINKIISQKATLYFESSEFSVDDLNAYIKYSNSLNFKNIYILINKFDKSTKNYILSDSKLKFNAKVPYNSLIQLIEIAKNNNAQIEINSHGYSPKQLENLLTSGAKITINSNIGELELNELIKNYPDKLTLFSYQDSATNLRNYIESGIKIIINNQDKTYISSELSALLKEFPNKAKNISILAQNFFPPDLAIFRLNKANVLFMCDSDHLDLKDSISSHAKKK
ncbi:MAG: hypothetical protein NT007_07700 [Candidatus Kapabacteria bacterium]|nr:hypothetical protein [Candidatus Kapabacteria bacterium]